MGERAILKDYLFSVDNPKGTTTHSVSTRNILGGDIDYCNRPDDEVRRNRNAVRRLVSDILRINRSTKLDELGQYIELARRDEPNEYSLMQDRAESILMPHFGFEPANEVDRAKFRSVFRATCDAHDEAVDEVKRQVAPVLDDYSLRRLEMVQEVKYARTPLALLENMFQAQSIQRSYEGRRKFEAVLSTIPALLEQDRFEDVGGEIFAILRRNGVISGSPDIHRKIIAKVYENSGECFTWTPYVRGKHKTLKHGTDSDSQSWREMSFSYPSRVSANGLPIYFTDREKKDSASIVLKAMRKGEIPDDQCAFRVVVDETQMATTIQMQLFFQHMATAFEAEGYVVSIDTDEGYTNKLTDEFEIIVGGKNQKFPTDKKNANNDTSSSKRRALQTDWKLVQNGKQIQFEVQAMDTLGDINRAVNGEWGDDVYKIVQLFKPFADGTKTNMANSFFPKYVYGFDIDMYREELMHYALQRSLNSPNRNKLPDEKH